MPDGVPPPPDALGGDRPGDPLPDHPDADRAPPAGAVDVPTGVPSRAAFVLAFAAVVVAGVFGAVIGFGLTDLGCDGDCTVAVTVGTLVGAVGAAAGVGVVATLVLRAMSEWDGARRRAG